MRGIRARWRSLVEALLTPVDAAWLAAFRVCYGVVLCVSMLRFIGYGWIESLFTSATFRFKYLGFEWVEPLSNDAMYALFWALAACALCLALGLFFRLSSALFALGLVYVQLIDVSTYLNHYYLAALLAGLLCISPAARSYSLDAWLKRRLSGSGPRPPEVASGWLYLFRFQVGVVYTFAGLAKLGPDWLLHGQPLRMWLSASTSLPVIGPLLAIDWVPLAMSWAGFLFDTTIVIWLSLSKTRPYAYAVVIVFHVLTRLLFPIGMFPAIMVLSALVFFSPSWPRRLWARLQAFLGRSAAAPREPVLEARAPRIRKLHYAVIGLGLAYCAVHVILPLRFLAYGGNVLWHEQGMRFSWRVMVRAKGGSTTFVVTNKRTGRVWHVSPRTYLTPLQETEMASQPDLILQLAHHVRQDFERRGLGPVEVRADATVSLNGRRGRRLIDPSLDLSTVRDGLARAEWVLPAPPEPPPHTRPVL